MASISNAPNVTTMFTELKELVSQNGREIGDGRKVLLVTSVKVPDLNLNHTMDLTTYRDGGCSMTGWSHATEHDVYFSSKGDLLSRRDMTPMTGQQLINTRNLLNAVKKAITDDSRNILQA